MSELLQNRHESGRGTFHWKLLSTVSALTLIACTSAPMTAEAEDLDTGHVWIELGGQLSRLVDGKETFAPPAFDNRPSMFSPSTEFEKSPLFAFDMDGKISLQPSNSNWLFSVSVRYGRSTSKRHVHQQTYPDAVPLRLQSSGGIYSFPPWQPYAAKFADTVVRNSEQHTILDFQAGKDVGLGLFGSTNASSVFSVGVRYANFTDRSNITIKSDPDWHFAYKYLPSLKSIGFTSSRYVASQPYHSNRASFHATRSFHGIGPSLSWSASAPFVGNMHQGELSLDWGVNVAVLFGRQKARTHHQTTARYGHADGYAPTHVTLYQHPATPDHTRSRMVTVPNVGGFAGLSWQADNFKASFGYRADFFLGAMDGGIDARQTYDRDFYGPYATISIGLGG